MEPGKSRRTQLIVAGSLLALALVVHDTAVGTDRSFGTRAALLFIDSYRAHVSTRLGGIVLCRFRPSCSEYGREVIRRDGLLTGGAKTIWRIARCGPWTPAGTADPP